MSDSPLPPSGVSLRFVHVARPVDPSETSYVGPGVLEVTHAIAVWRPDPDGLAETGSDRGERTATGPSLREWAISIDPTLAGQTDAQVARRVADKLRKLNGTDAIGFARVTRMRRAN